MIKIGLFVTVLEEMGMQGFSPVLHNNGGGVCVCVGGGGAIFITAGLSRGSRATH